MSGVAVAGIAGEAAQLESIGHFAEEGKWAAAGVRCDYCVDSSIDSDGESVLCNKLLFTAANSRV